MKIPWADTFLDESEVNEVTAAVRSSWISKGPRVEKFEEKLQTLVGAKHCIAVNSGTAALDVALKCLKISSGDEVIVPAFTYIASANAILYQHATPVFVDIDPKTFTIDIEDVKQKITEKTKAIIAVDYAGQGPDYSALRKAVEGRNIKIIEDGAPGLGGLQKGKQLCSFGDISITSFHAVKTFTTAEGGMIFTENDEYARVARIILNQGEDPHEKYNHPMLGHNFRMTDIHAAIGLAQFARFREVLDKRKNIARFYSKAFADIKEIQVPYEIEGDQHAWFLYPILIERRDIVRSQLAEKGIGTNVSWPKPIYDQEHFKEFKNATCPVAEKTTKEVLCLPLFHHMTDEQMEYVTNSLIEIIQNGN